MTTVGRDPTSPSTNLTNAEVTKSSHFSLNQTMTLLFGGWGASTSSSPPSSSMVKSMSGTALRVVVLVVEVVVFGEAFARPAVVVVGAVGCRIEGAGVCQPVTPPSPEDASGASPMKAEGMGGRRGAPVVVNAENPPLLLLLLLITESLLLVLRTKSLLLLLLLGLGSKESSSLPLLLLLELRSLWGWFLRTPGLEAGHGSPEGCCRGRHLRAQEGCRTRSHLGFGLSPTHDSSLHWGCRRDRR